MKRTLQLLAIGLASLAVLFVGASALAYWLLDVDALVQQAIDEQKPGIEKQLGRKVEIGSVHTRFFPTLGATLGGIAVAPAEGAPEGESPLLSIDRMGFDLDLWGALISLGSRVELASIYLDGMKVEIVRRADGSLSIADLLDRPSAPSEEDSGGLDPELAELLARIRIDEIRLGGAQIRLVDQVPATPRVHEVQKIDLRLDNVGLGRTLGVKFSAAAFQERPNVSFGAKIGPIPADLQIEGLLPMEDVRLSVEGLDLAPLAAWVPGVEAGMVHANWDIPSLKPNAPTEVKGKLAVAGLKLPGGRPTDLNTDADVGIDLRSLDLDVRRLDLGLGTIRITAAGGLRDLGGVPRFESFSIKSPNFDPGEIFALYPEALASLPAGSRITGPIAIDLVASGTATEQTASLKVDASRLDVLLPGTFQKPVGTALGFEVDGDFNASVANLKKARFLLDELDLSATGTLRDFDRPTFDFTLSAAPFSFDRLVRLLPQAAEQLAASGTTASGKGSLSGHLKGSLQNVDADLSLALQGLSLDLPDTEVRGDVQVKVFAKGAPEGDLKAGLLVDAGPSVIRIPGLLDKAAATPLLFDLAVDKSGQRVRFERFDAHLADAKLTASGALDLSGGDSALQFRLLPLDLEGLARTVPALPKEKLQGGRLSLGLKVQGDPLRSETVSVALEDFDLKIGRSQIKARATVKNLSAPDIVAHVESPFLDVDEWMPPESEQTEKAEGAEREDDPSLKALRAVATFEVKKAIVTGRTLEDLRGRMVLRDGIIHVEEARFGVYDGTVRAAGTEIEFWKGRMPFKARLVVQNVDVARLVAGEFETVDLVSGRANFDLSLDGEGFDKASLEESLSGGWSLSLLQGKLSGADISRAVLGGLADLPGLQPQRLASDGDLRDLMTSFQVENGKMNLRKPLTLSLDGNRVELGGAVGIAGDLFLEGTYWVSPQMLSKVTGGRCQVAAPAAVPLKISGSPTKPEIRPDGKAVALTLAKGCLAGKVTEAVDRLVGQGASERIEDAASAAKQKLDAARDDAERKAAEARAETERLAAEARAEADRKAQQAKDAARKKAEEEAKKLKGRFGL